MDEAFGKIVHILPLSLMDYPGKLACVFFFAGCNLRCPFCYNAELVLPELWKDFRPLPWEEVKHWLAERAGFLDGVVLTGGEPTLSPDLPRIAAELKELGFLVKLDTNGTRPEVLGELFRADLVDYVALDLKAPSSRYAEYTGREGEEIPRAIQRSIEVILEKAKDYEFRTTVAPGLSEEDLLSIAQEIRQAKRYVLQPFFAPMGKRLVDESWREKPALSIEKLSEILPELRKILPVELRA
jgi:pyruvate formate lyase activating enzyme